MKLRGLLFAAASTIALSAIGSANAQAADDNVPNARALESVDRNLQKDPDNRGLQNAQKRLEANEQRHKLQRADAMADRVERIDRVERVERVERVDRIERPAHM